MLTIWSFSALVRGNLASSSMSWCSASAVSCLSAPRFKCFFTWEPPHPKEVVPSGRG